jgi:hypothetical protein
MQLTYRSLAVAENPEGSRRHHRNVHQLPCAGVDDLPLALGKSIASETTLGIDSAAPSAVTILNVSEKLLDL